MPLLVFARDGERICVYAEKTNFRGSITLRLTSCFNYYDSAVFLMLN